MDRLKILVLDRNNGVICNECVDVETMMSFLHRSNRIHKLQVVAYKGKSAIFFEKIDPQTIVKELFEFQNKK